MPSSPELTRVKRAADKRRASEQEYRGAVAAARAAGHSLAAIAAVAGVTRQAIFKLSRARR